MTLLHTIPAFLVALSVLVFVHEFGHYCAARCCRVKVLRFSLGMGRIIWSRRFGRDQTEWALSILPFGGYVKLLDARTQDTGTLAPEDAAREFTRQTVWRRIAIVAAGPLANFLLALVLLAGIFLHGLPEPLARLHTVSENTPAWQAGLRGGERIIGVNGTAAESWTAAQWKILEVLMSEKSLVLEVLPPAADASRARFVTIALPGDARTGMETEQALGLRLAYPPIVVARVLPGKAAMKAGLLTDDRIASINGDAVHTADAFVEAVKKLPGTPFALGIYRAGKPLTLTLTPERVSENGQVVGRIYAELASVPEMVWVQYGFMDALGKGAEKTWDVTVLTCRVLWKMLTGAASVKNIAGPLTIADYAGKTAGMGLVQYLSFIALISISIGLMNLLPIPVLDGGFLLYYAVEAISGYVISGRTEAIAQRVGVAVLVVLMAMSLFSDVLRLVN
ncbi:MAG: RIP metalloprotease RseP [Burkholderiaceae bacterium]|jgi:regulator of sigma E protease|nr:RIP metalloprotease RseP [Burkholderiaceae bacterium]